MSWRGLKILHLPREARGRAVPNPLSLQTEAVGGVELARRMRGWPWLCLHCVHCRVADGVPAPRPLRALSGGKLTCSLRLPLPCGGNSCDGFCPAEKTDSHKQPQKALTSCPSCGLMGAPKHVRRHKSLSGFPRAGQILVCILSLQSTPASFLAGCLLILGRLQRPISVRVRRLHMAGERCSLPFFFSQTCEVFHV